LVDEPKVARRKPGDFFYVCAQVTARSHNGACAPQQLALVNRA
jgi:uncharacterized RmlC-like cupin family protein